MAVLNCCSAPTGLKIAILWWCTGDCWENSCPTPPHLLHPYFPLSGAISTITLGSAPQKCRRLHPITQNSWHEWVFPHAQSGKEGGCQHATALLQLYFSWIFIVKQRNREWCHPLEIQQKGSVLLEHTHAQPLLWETPQCPVLTPMPASSHADSARVSKVLDYSQQQDLCLGLSSVTWGNSSVSARRIWHNTPVLPKPDTTRVHDTCPNITLQQSKTIDQHQPPRLDLVLIWWTSNIMLFTCN